MKKTILLTCTLLFALSTKSLIGQTTVIDTTQKSIICNIYASLSNPILYGKTGLGLMFKGHNLDYLISGNVRFSEGLIKEYVISSIDKVGSNGFDIGAQLRFKNKLKRKPYAQYLDERIKAWTFF
jgi:hypothetical protein